MSKNVSDCRSHENYSIVFMAVVYANLSLCYFLIDDELTDDVTVRLMTRLSCFVCSVTCHRTRRRLQITHQWRHHGVWEIWRHATSGCRLAVFDRGFQRCLAAKCPTRQTDWQTYGLIHGGPKNESTLFDCWRLKNSRLIYTIVVLIENKRSQTQHCCRQPQTLN